MGEEEAALGVVGICVGFRVLMVDAMIPRPLINVILQRKKKGHAEDKKIMRAL